MKLVSMTPYSNKQNDYDTKISLAFAATTLTTGPCNPYCSAQRPAICSFIGNCRHCSLCSPSPNSDLAQNAARLRACRFPSLSVYDRVLVKGAVALFLSSLSANTAGLFRPGGFQFFALPRRHTETTRRTMPRPRLGRRHCDRLHLWAVAIYRRLYPHRYRLFGRTHRSIRDK